MVLIHEDAHVSVVAIRETPVRYEVTPNGAPPKARCVFVHGLCEHGFRIFPLARRLAAFGVATTSFHLLGHGAPPGREEEFEWLGRAYAAEGEAAETLQRLEQSSEERLGAVRGAVEANLRTLRSQSVEDQLNQVRSVLNRVADLDPDLPLFLAGHSLGGLLACESGWRFGTEQPSRLAGVLLSSPALRPIPPPAAGWATRSALRASWGSRSSPWGRPFGALLRAFARLGPRVDCSWASAVFSDETPENDLHAGDPLLAGAVPAPYLVRIEDQMWRTHGRAESYPVSVLLIAGSEDRIVAFDGCQRFAQALPTERVMTWFPGQQAAHDLARSSMRERFWREVVAWRPFRGVTAGDARL